MKPHERSPSIGRGGQFCRSNEHRATSEKNLTCQYEGLFRTMEAHWHIQRPISCCFRDVWFLPSQAPVHGIVTYFVPFDPARSLRTARHTHQRTSMYARSAVRAPLRHRGYMLAQAVARRGALNQRAAKACHIWQGRLLSWASPGQVAAPLLPAPHVCP